MRVLLPSRSLPRSSCGMLPTSSAGRSSAFCAAIPAVANPRHATISSANGVFTGASSGERGAGQVFVPAGPRHHVVLDAHAAELLELLDAAPLDHLADGLVLRFVQQLVDEIETGLHGDHEAILEMTG